MINSILEHDVGITAVSVMDDCHKYGVINGCDIDCPVLMRGECELKDDENKELYQECLDQQGVNK